MGISSDIIIPLQDGSRIILRSSAAGPLELEGLARLLRVDPQDAAPEAMPNLEATASQERSKSCLPLTGSPENTVHLNRETGTFLLTILRKRSVYREHYCVWNWRRSFFFALLSAMMRGAKVLPVHGAILVTPRGGIMLCGESGVGKSTTVRRWHECGNEAPADDLLLLQYGKEGLSVLPLPTWSRCLISPAGLEYPVRRRIPLAGVLALARGDSTEEIRPVSHADFFAQLYSSCFSQLRLLLDLLPAEERAAILKTIRDGVEALLKQFAPSALFARPDGDLKETLKEYL